MLYLMHESYKRLVLYFNKSYNYIISKYFAIFDTLMTRSYVKYVFALKEASRC